MNKRVYVKYDEKFKPDEPYYKREFFYMILIKMLEIQFGLNIVLN
jgi:hypothetical protein